MDWGRIENVLDVFNGDTLVIMDCCQATAAATRDSKHEYLFASALESRTTSIVAHGFTWRLIDLLKVNNGNEMTVAQMHAKLIGNANDTQNRLSNSPVHVASKTRSLITLRPLKTQVSNKGDTKPTGKVLISVRLQGSHGVPDMKECEQWLAQNIPDDVAEVKIQAAFDSGSMLVLLTVPIHVWDMLEDHEAYSFVDFVTSDNKYLGNE